MKRFKWIYILISFLLINFTGVVVADTTADKTPDAVLNIFENNGAVMLVIDSETGKIVNANQAATRFYGYSKETLMTMNISDINTLTPDEIKVEMSDAIQQSRNYFNFIHRLKTGEVRNVEVYSYPYASDKGDNLLLSTIYDVTWKN